MDTIFEQLRARAYFSPDIFEDVIEFENHLVFIDGGLKLDQPLWSKFLSNAKYLGTGITLMDHFIMKRTNNTPITFHDPKHKAKAKVVGEVWAVTPIELLALDGFHHNGDYFQRRKHSIKLVDQPAPYKNHNQKTVIQCWCYIGLEPAWENTTLAFAGKLKVGKDFHWNWDPKTPIGS